MSMTASEMGHLSQKARLLRIAEEVDTRWPHLDPETRQQRIDEFYRAEQTAASHKAAYVRKANRIARQRAAAITS